MTRRILLVGGAPRLAVDAVRFLSVRASGDTAVALATALRPDRAVDLLLGPLARPEAPALRYEDRAGLELALQQWLARHPDGLVVMSAAINDYQIAAVERRSGGATRSYLPGEKVPSGGDEVVIRLRPADKVIDRLRAWGHRGPLVGFKYEDATTVIASAQALQTRTGAALVVANSLDGHLQALIQPDAIQRFDERASLLATLTVTLRHLSSR